ncbi:hypothetical protein NLI96_g12715 [Meripilus lineatus]|uniref:Uncharacterized protein n=1 Tax=Meripilus lineatus TaxID=2056292 RepID=A0AAD5UQP9_9APHY|nr:hypothetical protein NLI96_g12715 [Physisporinus lineatus]
MSPSTFFGPINYTPESPTHHRIVTSEDGKTAGDDHTTGDETTAGDMTIAGDTSTAPGQEKVGDTGDGELISNIPTARDLQRSGDGPVIGSDGSENPGDGHLSGNHQHAGDDQ